jgi:sigma-B regulation protein RsbU (phosphoserine phosphatase)
MNADLASILRQIPMFARLPSSEIGFLSSALHEVEIPAGTLLFREGDPGDRFYIILEGTISVIKALDTSDERIIATRRPGEFFGEMSLVEPDGLRTASVRSNTPLRLLEMSRPDFDALLLQRPVLALEIIRVLSLRLDQSHNSTIASLREKNRQLTQACDELKAAQTQIIEKERLEKELETARWIQQSILPRALPGLPGFDLGAFLMPARAVGGDLFDLIPLRKDALGVVIGDVSDKGVPAAIFMALTFSLLRAEAPRAGRPAKVLQAVNRILLDMNNAGMFVTVLYGVLERAQPRFTYARAGHELPLHLGPAGQAHQIGHDTGQPLGLLARPALDEQSVDLEPGDVLLLYTDGATDLIDAQGQRLGRKRFEALVQASRTGRAQAICDRVWAGLAEYQASNPQFDDVALLAIRVEG